MFRSGQNSKFFIELSAILVVAQFQLHDVVIVGPFPAFEAEHLCSVHLDAGGCGRFDFHVLIFAVCSDRLNDLCLLEAMIDV